MNHDHPVHVTPPSFWGSRYSIGLLLFGAAAAYFLLTEHRAHFFSALPFLILLACPLMHVFMHHGHGGHDSHSNTDEPVKPEPTKPGAPL
ncbi:MAG: DUF2933 domain-containing protein [Rhodocyclaceae bacterium]|nr:DUF2933 domain-containing protein [Rhodocyclaceae bacterium]MBP6109934.1 DUF2933 domain-containing protein [Rhodocyclaceae bacterium]